MTRLHQEWYASAVFSPYSIDGKPAPAQRYAVGNIIIGDRAWAEEKLAEYKAACPDHTGWVLQENSYLVWSDYNEQRAAERAETERLELILTTPPEVRWRVVCRRPGETELELYCQDSMVLVAPTQEAIDRACANPAFLDRSTGSTGESWWDERG